MNTSLPSSVVRVSTGCWRNNHAEPTPDASGMLVKGTGVDIVMEMMPRVRYCEDHGRRIIQSNANARRYTPYNSATILRLHEWLID